MGIDESSLPSLRAGADGAASIIRATHAGCIHSIEVGATLVNQALANPLAGGLHRMYLRQWTSDGAMTSTEIVGPGARSAFSHGAARLHWHGEVGSLRYDVRCGLHASGRTWGFEVEVTCRGAGTIHCDVVMLQDVGIASRGQIRSNELFTSQYLDHQAHRSVDHGWVVMSRQNLPQDACRHPWLMQGCIPAAAGFLTDGVEFFGLGSKDGAGPAALERLNIGDHVTQGEAGWIAVQSGAMTLAGGTSDRVTFFAHFVDDHPDPSCERELQRLDLVSSQLRESLQRDTSDPVSKVDVRAAPDSVFRSPLLHVHELTMDDVAALLPGVRRHEEWVNGVLHSYFYGPDSRHVVLRAKELASVRPHGHVMRSGEGLMPDDEVLSCAFYAAGVFGSQLTCGNTSLVKLLSPARDPLNLLRASGLRLFVRMGGESSWHQLGVPSAFEMALDQCRWIYKHAQGTIIVTCDAMRATPQVTYCVEATGRAIEVLVTAELAVAPAEYEAPVRVRVDAPKGTISVRPGEGSFLQQRQPDLNFVIRIADPSQVSAIGGAELLSDAATGAEPYVAIVTAATHSFSFCIAGSFSTKEPEACVGVDPLAHSQTPFWRSIRANLSLAHRSNPAVSQLQDALNWFSRDAVIHMANPRGLEQANGGAWGVRDVCQGAVEFLLAYDHAPVVAEVLRAVFSQQYERRGDWPQWFMFPPYHEIQSRHCHGDVMIWPLKALCDYLEHSNDFSVLEERLPFTSDESLTPTRERHSMLHHVDRLIAKFQGEFLKGTSLPCYGDGDWDDSLQPADASLRRQMVSSWTAALMFQTLSRWAVALQRFGDDRRAREASGLAESIRLDFQKHLVPDGIVAGFAIFNGSNLDYMLHPRDVRTGLRYRLIPMTRGILSGIFTPRQAETHLELIRTQLLYPDGARLMDRPTGYDGGRERIFRRAESAAFFGREIGLMYVHAHLRYAEAMAVLGRADELWRAVQVTNPITVTEVVPNAAARQRNCYFTSSDAAFVDRRHASRCYGQLRTGEVAVNGGWRVYSSGPGLFSNVVVRHMLGLRTHYDCLDVDPVLPAELDGLSADIDWRGHALRVSYHRDPHRPSADRVRVNGQPVSRWLVPAEGHYRSIATRLPIEAFRHLLHEDGSTNSVEVSF